MGPDALYENKFQNNKYMIQNITSIFGGSFY